MEKSIITYETIYEFLRNEKNKDELQKLSESFFDDVGQYLGGKEKVLRDCAAKTDVFSQKEFDKTRLQLQNVKTIINDLYTRREKKIIDLAINLVRTRSRIVDTSTLHSREKDFFDGVVAVLERYRGSLLADLLTGKDPIIPVPSVAPTESEESSATETPNPMGKKVEFLSAIDAFMDAELNEFGPFSQGESAVIPKEIANILITEGKAREMHE